MAGKKTVTEVNAQGGVKKPKKKPKMVELSSVEMSFEFASEISAIARVVAALEGLSKAAQYRVIEYSAKALGSGL